jgi:hypothetical protein
MNANYDDNNKHIYRSAKGINGKTSSTGEKMAHYMPL